MLSIFLCHYLVLHSAPFHILDFLTDRIFIFGLFCSEILQVLQSTFLFLHDFFVLRQWFLEKLAESLHTSELPDHFEGESSTLVNVSGLYILAEYFEYLVDFSIVDGGYLLMMEVQKCGELVSLVFGPISMLVILYVFSWLGGTSGDWYKEMASVVELEISC